VRNRKPVIMEVCGTHTYVVAKSGIKSIIGDKARLVSGPGCPVCVTPAGCIDKLVELSKQDGNFVLSFGDLMKVPGNNGSLATCGGNSDYVYSPLDAVAIALNNPSIQYTFAAVGFEATAAVYAVMLSEMILKGIANLKLLTAMKTMLPAMDFICRNEDVDGFLCPGNVSAIIGSKPYEALAEKRKKPMAVVGFEPDKILEATNYLIDSISEGNTQVKNFYRDVVDEEGNMNAKELMNNFFEPTDAYWRGIGIIENSGLALRKEFSRFDAGGYDNGEELAGCLCADVCLGRVQPSDCPLFGKECTYENPAGPCMVSAEGACGIYAAMVEFANMS
jgi:hydrogenase expression/formation protein HypD